jgi:hypothetical protein
LHTLYRPRQLAVTCLYARRGGIDINPTRVSNVDLLKKIKFLLKDQGMTINGVKKLLNLGHSNDLDEISNISKIIKDLKRFK